MILVAVLCCLLLLLILGLTLGLTLGRNKNDGNNNNSNGSGNGSVSNPNNPSGPTGSRPTIPSFPSPQAPQPAPVLPPFLQPTEPNPTPAPIVVPTPSPVPVPTSLLQPTPNQFIILPSADTTIHLDGFRPFENYGKDESFLVQNGPRDTNEIPDTIALLSFDIVGEPINPVQVILQLWHVPANRNRGAATLTILRLPPTKLSVENLHKGLFEVPEDTEAFLGPTFEVSPLQTQVEIDITNFFLDFRATEESSDQFYLMIQNRGPEQREGATGDRFRSRETSDPPQLILRYGV